MSTEVEYTKPLPTIEPETEEFWKAAKRHELFLQRCNACDEVIHFPRVMCYRCLSEDLGWIQVNRTRNGLLLHDYPSGCASGL